ncbi:MAG: hypothetical protein H6862_05245 [Rhodospirillales bacterium]|nr:hypothetical protein [Rhodospirillales bacterium]
MKMPVFSARIFRLVLVLAAFLPAACGFHPVYGTGGSGAGQAVGGDLSRIEIGPIPDHSGQILRNILIDRFYRTGRPVDAPWSLSLSPIQESLTDLDITRDSDTTRTQIRLRTDVALTEKATGKTLLTRRIESVTSYNVLGSEFATRVTREDARRNALADLARQIEQELSLYFARGGT